MEQSPRSTEFVALGHAGSGHYAGLETFPNPGVSHVERLVGERVNGPHSYCGHAPGQGPSPLNVPVIVDAIATVA
jgi:hypothetical protein